MIMAITSIEVYGVIIAGWASNLKYLLGALRAWRRWSASEIASGLRFVIVLMWCRGQHEPLRDIG